VTSRRLELVDALRGLDRIGQLAHHGRVARGSVGCVGERESRGFNWIQEKPFNR
jgi:hypothetical protein